jgi:hypothetical protein
MRHYFYVLDLRGNIFLEESKHRNIATCIKDISFQNFMLRNLKPNYSTDFPDIPLLVKCGHETNFVTPIDSLSSFVHKELRDTELKFGGSLSQEFNPLLLRYNSISQRLYHIIINHKYLNGHFALLHPEICQYLTNHIYTAENAYYLQWGSVDYQLLEI